MNERLTRKVSKEDCIYGFDTGDYIPVGLPENIGYSNEICKEHCKKQTCDFTKDDCCKDCIINNVINKLGRMEDRQINLKNRLTQRSEVVEGYILKDMDDDCAESSCSELCFINDGECNKCQLHEAIQTVGEYEDMEETNESKDNI